MEHIIIIGGGTGGALAHDLALRGFKVTLVERGGLVSGTTGRHHGLLHSGARYVLHDIPTARECGVENRIIRRIAPQSLEQNQGLFVALDDSDMAHYTPFMEGCRSAGIPAKPLSADRARQLEPALSPNIKAAVEVPDAVMDAWRLPMQFLATARHNGASIRSFSEVVAIVLAGRTATGVTVRDHRTHEKRTLYGDLIVNAAGPWAGRITAMAGIDIPLTPAPGVMVSLPKRLTDRVINRLHPAGDGDIVVPQRGLSILGTSAWLADDPDDISLPPAHIREMRTLCAKMLPGVAELPNHAVWSASRPLITDHTEADPTRISRGFKALDHAAAHGIQGLVSILGGKATTMRAMAEETADLICRKTGRKISCTTRRSPLLSYRRFFKRP